MNSILIKLAKIADRLDHQGNHSAADDIDFVIKKYTSKKISFEKFAGRKDIVIDIPEQEYLNLKSVLSDLGRSLKKNN
jgi:hypothetical protein